MNDAAGEREQGARAESEAYDQLPGYCLMLYQCTV